MEVWVLWSVSEMLLLVAELYHLLLDKLALDYKLVDFTHKKEHAAGQNPDNPDLFTPVDLVVAGSTRRRSVELVKGRRVCPRRRLLVLHNGTFQATSESGKLLDFTLFCRKNRCKMQMIKDEPQKHLYQQYHTHRVRKDGVKLVTTVAGTHMHGNMFAQEEEARGKMITAPYEGSDGWSALSAAQKWNNIHTNSAKGFAGRRRARRGRSGSPAAAAKAWYKEIE